MVWGAPRSPALDEPTSAGVPPSVAGCRRVCLWNRKAPCGKGSVGVETPRWPRGVARDGIPCWASPCPLTPIAGRPFYRARLGARLREIAASSEKATSNWNHIDLDGQAVALATFGIHPAYALHALIGGNSEENVPERITKLLWSGFAGTMAN